MRGFQQWEEARKFLAGATKKSATINNVLKDIEISNVSLGAYYTSKFCLALDLRTTDDDQLHGSGRRIENASEGITLQIAKKAETAGDLNIYVYLIMDGQLNIEDGRFVYALY